MFNLGEYMFLMRSKNRTR